MSDKTEPVALRLPPERNAVCALQLITLLRAAHLADREITYGEAAVTLGLVETLSEWSDRDIRVKAKTDLASVCAIAAALGLKDQKLWARLVTKDGDVGQGFYTDAYIVRTRVT
jgi:hypothetical protein